MKELYTFMYGIQLIQTIEDGVKDLSMWDVYNDDKYLEEIANILLQVTNLRKKITKINKKALSK